MPGKYNMIALNLPEADLLIKRRGDADFVFDMLRRRFVRLTAEEYVRQSFVNYLIRFKGFPKGLMNNEVSISLNTIKYRCDTVVFNREMSPVMIIEYKSPSCKITQSVLKQAYIYNMALRVNYLVLSNGLEHHCLFVDYEGKSVRVVGCIPDYSDLCLNV